MRRSPKQPELDRRHKLACHLVSAPWAQPYNTSSPVGALHAHLEATLGDELNVYSYSAFLGIPHRAAGGLLFQFYERASAAGEYAYMWLFLRRYWRELRAGRARFPIARFLDALDDRRPHDARLTAGMLSRLRRATEAYVDEEMAPRFLRGGINLIGFSLNYDQVYASLYMARYIQDRYLHFHPTFVFGGASAAVPHVVAVLHRLKAPGCLVLGEGEKKLEMIARRLLTHDPSAGLHPEALDPAVAGAAPGVYEVRANDQIFEPRTADFSTQIAGLTALPTPDYREYFQTLRELSDDTETFQLLTARSRIMVEGSRGCFAKCDFCGLNSTWRGFRSSTPEHIFGQIERLAARHASTNFAFVDNVCDTWAEKFAEIAMSRRMKVQSIYELRAHHPERFWTKLALSGAVEVQIGIESLSQPLLTHIGKGTKVVQNVAVQKYLTELGVTSYGNIITHHPRSTTADVRETQRILAACPHLGTFGLAVYGLAPGSPLYEQLPLDLKQSLRPAIRGDLPRELVPYAVDYFCEVPRELACSPEVRRAWAGFERWHHRFSDANRDGRARLYVSRLGPDKRVVTDTRGARQQRHLLEGDECRVYDACHAGPKLDRLPMLLGFSSERTQLAVDRLIQRGILLKIEDAVLSIALRPRDELIQNLYQAPASASERPAHATPMSEAPAPLVQLTTRLSRSIVRP